MNNIRGFASIGTGCTMDFVIGNDFVFAFIVASLGNMGAISFALMTKRCIRIMGRLQGFSLGLFFLL
jgi:hypothetical protein